LGRRVVPYVPPGEVGSANARKSQARSRDIDHQLVESDGAVCIKRATHKVGYGASTSNVVR
jgi:hypothetical protein